MPLRLLFAFGLACSTLGCTTTENLFHPVATPFELTTFDGTPVASSDVAGKVVVLDFWATWCGPCHAAFPHLQKVYDQYKDHLDVVFLAINTSWDDTRQAAERYIASEGYTFPVAWDEGGDVTRQFNVKGIPTTLIIGKDGRIRSSKSGFSTRHGYAQSLSARIEAQLQKPAPQRAPLTR